jgi:hypothetical protein
MLHASATPATERAACEAGAATGDAGNPRHLLCDAFFRLIVPGVFDFLLHFGVRATRQNEWYPAVHVREDLG